MSIEIPAVPRGANGDGLITHINDRLRRISQELGLGATGKTGAPGAPGTPGAGGIPINAYPVPVSAHIALPNASKAINVLTETGDTFVSTPAGLPAFGNNALWQLIIVQGAAGCSTSFAPSYLFSITATDASSPLAGKVTLNLSTNAAGNTSLISYSSTF